MSLCPNCNSDSRVTDSRPSDSGRVRRRRACEGCGLKWSTIEVGLESFQRLVRTERRFMKALADLNEAAAKSGERVIVGEAE